MKTILDRYPRLGQTLPRTMLGEFPTPVRRLEQLGTLLRIDALYMKDDGPSGKPYGGNKVRKLEYLLGEALRKGVMEVMTFGYAGSNHAAATSIYARQLGLQPISLLLPQTDADYVRKNLLLQVHSRAEIHVFPNIARLAFRASCLQIAKRMRTGRYPYIIPPGGTSSLGIVGIVSAVFELKEQIDRGLVPEPDCIYVAAGTMGTAVGLLVGICAAGLRTNLMAISVVPGKYVNMQRFTRMFCKEIDFLRQGDASFPALDFPAGRIQVRTEFVGPGYAHLTPECVEALQTIENYEGICLEGTYTGKTLAALFADARRGLLGGKTILFWNTYNRQPLEDLIAGLDYHNLPQTLHRYFVPDHLA